MPQSMVECSVLERVKPNEVITDPFPHLVVTEALDRGLCDRLVQEFPSMALVTDGAPYGSNQRFSYPTLKAQRNPATSQLWRDFLTYHVSQSFLDEAMTVFGRHILSEYPNFTGEIGDIRALRMGQAHVDTFDTCDVLMDMALSVNTPVTTRPTSVRAAHVDLSDKLISGLFYLRHPDDDSEGGDLELFRFRDDRFRFDGYQVSDKYVERVATVPYRANTLVMFVNSPRSLHGVSVRSLGKYPRMFLYFFCKVKKPMFDLRDRQKSLVYKAYRRYVLRRQY